MCVCVFVCVSVHAQSRSQELVIITRGMYILPSHPGSFMHVQVWVGAGHGIMTWTSEISIKAGQ